MGIFSTTPEERGNKIGKLLGLRGGSEKIDELLEKGVVLQPRYGSHGVLAGAIDGRHTKLIAYCIENRIGLNEPGLYRETPLMKAIDRKDAALVKKLLAVGVRTTDTDRYGRTVVMQALAKGNLEIAKMLVKNPRYLRQKTGRGYTCVNAALESGKIEILQYVLAAKPALNTTHDSLPILFAAIDTRDAQMFDMLVKAGAKIDIQQKGRYGQTLIAYARENGCKEVKARLKKIEDRKKELKAAADKLARTGWRLTGEAEVCRIEEPAVIPYKVTEIFNFKSGVYTRINQNLETKAESAAVMNIAQIANRAFVEEAMAQLEVLGGKMPEDSALPLRTPLVQTAAKTIIEKPKAAS